MANEKKYSRIELLLNAGIGHVFGAFIGTIEGVIGSLAVPTSIRHINDNLDENIDETFGNSKKRTVGDKLENLTYHYTRLATRLGTHGTAMYKMVEDIANGGDMSYGLLAIPNLISAGYEIYRFARR